MGQSHRFFLLLLFVPLTFSGCFLMGLPEIFTDTSFKQDRTLEKILILDDEEQLVGEFEEEEEQREVLGHQYVLFLFPITRLFFQHTAKTFYTELLSQMLIEKGYNVFITKKKDLLDAAHTLRPRYIFEPDYSNLNINGYDAFFFRVIKIDAELKLRMWQVDGNNLRPIDKTRKIEFSEFSRYASTVLLASLLEKKSRDLFAQLIAEHVQAKLQNRYNELLIDNLLVISLPEVAHNLSVDFSQKLTSSYGFKSVKNFSQASIMRIIQRGLRVGVEQDRVAIVSSLSSKIPTNLRRGEVLAGLASNWTLRSELVELKWSEESEEMFLELNFELLDLSNPSNKMQSIKCRVKQQAVSGVDGFLVRTLEKAAQSVARLMWNRSESQIGSCVDNN